MTPISIPPAIGARVRTAVLLPGVLVGFAVLSGAVYLVPGEWLGVDVWDEMSVYAYGEGPFRPSAHGERARHGGDLAKLADLAVEEYWPVKVTSDRLGYRNPRGVGFVRPATVFLGGDSFAGGWSNTDAGTLSEQLHAAAGWNVYNMAHPYWEESPEDCLKLIQRLGQTPKLFLYEQVERVPLPFPGLARERGFEFRGRMYARGGLVHRLVLLGRELGANNRLRVALSRMRRRVERMAGIPSRAEVAVVAGTLLDGRSILFHADERKQGDPKRLAAAVEYFAHFREVMGRHGIGFAVVLVPNKLTVYNGLLRQPFALEERLPLEAVERALAGRGIPVINLTQAMREEALREFTAGRFLYYRQDTHWNARGIGLAAKAVVGVLASEVSNR